MTMFLRLSAGVLIAVFLIVVLAKQEKDYALLLSLFVCTLVMAAAVSYLDELLTFLEELSAAGEMQTQWLRLLLKIVGVGLISRITAMVCADSGNRSMEQAVQILTSGVILWLCLPLFEQMMELIQGVLRAI